MIDFNKQYVSLEAALKLREKGYPQTFDVEDENYDMLTEMTMVRFTDEPNNIMSYYSAELCAYTEKWYQERHNFETVIAPSYYEAMIWLMENLNIHCSPTCEIDHDSDGNVKGYHYDYDVIKIDADNEMSETQYNNGYGLKYEDALKAGIEKIISEL